QPFGDTNAVTGAAKGLTKWSEDFEKKLRGAKYDKEGAQRILRNITTVATGELPDFESARQLTWAFETVYQDVAGYDGQGKPLPGDAAVRKTLQGLRTGLNLELPAGREKKLLDFLNASLERQQAYEPEQFQEAFRQLAKQIPQR